MRPSLRVALLLSAPAAATGGAVAVPAHYEDFAGTIGTVLAGKALTQGGLSWVGVLGSAADANAIKLNGTGEYSCITANNSGVLATAGYSDAFWVSREYGPFWATAASGGNIVQMIHGGFVSGNLWNKVTVGSTAAPGFTSVKHFDSRASPVNAGSTAVDQGGAGNIQFEPGDTHTVRHRKSGANLFLDHYMNHRKVFTGTVDLTPNAFLNGAVGFMAGLTAAVANKGPISGITFGDPTALSMITVEGSCRVRQINADGSIDFYLFGEYTGLTAPTSLKWSLYDLTSGAEVVEPNVTSVTLSNFAATAAVAGIGTWSATYHVAAADHAGIGNKIRHQVEWTLNDAAHTVVVSKGGVERVGHTGIETGQSLTLKQMDVVTAGATPAGWQVDASNDVTTPAINRRTRKGASTTHVSRWAVAFAGYASLSDTFSVAYMYAGRGGTFFLHPTIPANGRTLGTATDDALVEGLARIGNRAAFLEFTFGQGEGTDNGSFISGGFAANTTYQANEEAALVAYWNAMEDRMGLTRNTLPIIIMPVNAWNAATAFAADYQAVRRFQWYLVEKYKGTRPMYHGPISYDAQHLSTDNFHHTDTAYQETIRRSAKLHAKILGYTAGDFNGPTFTGLTRVNATTLRGSFALNSGGDTIEIVNANAVAASGYGGGMQFSTSSGFGSLVAPTSVSVIDANTIEWGFPGSSFPGTAYARAAYGDNPFNPAQDGAATGSGINANMATQACMIREHFAAGALPSLPLRSYFNPADVTIAAPGSRSDYISAS